MKPRRAQEDHTHADLLAWLQELEDRLGDLTPSGVWGTTSVLNRNGFGFATLNDITYAVGGRVSTTPSAAVERAVVLGDGGLSAWTPDTSLPASRAWPGAAVLNGYLYVIGGYVSGSYTATVEYSEIQPDGSLGAWSSGTSIPAARGYPMVFAHGTELYVMGGFSGSDAQTTIYVATPDAGTGATGSWSTNATPLWEKRYAAGYAVWDDRIYVAGGTSYASYQSTVRSAPISGGAIGSWDAHTSLSATATWPGAVVFNDSLYIIGGDNPASNVVSKAAIASDGSITSWSAYVSLPPTSWNYGGTALHSSLSGALAIFGGSVSGGAGYKITLT